MSTNIVRLTLLAVFDSGGGGQQIYDSPKDNQEDEGSDAVDGQVFSIFSTIFIIAIKDEVTKDVKNKDKKSNTKKKWDQ